MKDLELLGDIEKAAIQAHLESKTELYYKLLKAYFQKLCSMVKFDRQAYKAKFETIKNTIFSLDSNKDGKIDEWEILENQGVMGKALEDLEELYFELTEIKVDCGLSVQRVSHDFAVRKHKEREQRTDMPVLDI